MNKLTALKQLSNAYQYLMDLSKQKWLVTDFEATTILEDKFNQVRRSLRLGDLKPQPKCTEGYNPKGPTFF